MTRVLITGGAGFIGSHAATALLAAGYEVRILDNLSPQVHGVGRHRPSYLTADAELMIGDVTDATPLASCNFAANGAITELSSGLPSVECRITGAGSAAPAAKWA